eukprot:372479-Pelagomonas_calceolata.AAC.1
MMHRLCPCIIACAHASLLVPIHASLLAPMMHRLCPCIIACAHASSLALIHVSSVVHIHASSLAPIHALLVGGQVVGSAPQWPAGSSAEGSCESAHQLCSCTSSKSAHPSAQLPHSMREAVYIQNKAVQQHPGQDASLFDYACLGACFCVPLLLIQEAVKMQYRAWPGHKRATHTQTHAHTRTHTHTHTHARTHARTHTHTQECGLWRYAAHLTAHALTGVERAESLHRWAQYVLRAEGNTWGATGILVAAGCLREALQICILRLLNSLPRLAFKHGRASIQLS